MTLRELRYLVALADLGHFGRAAEACHVSQPTLSTQLKKLEESLGVALFERTNKMLRITPVGEQIVAKARRVLDGADSISALAQHQAGPLSGALDLGVIPTLAPYMLPWLLPVLGRDYPELQLVVHEDLTERLLGELRANRIDAALLALPVDGAEFAVLPLFDEPFHLAVPSGHRLSGAQAVAQSELRREELLLLREGHCLRDQALAVCSFEAPPGAHHGVDVRAASLETLCRMVAAGMGCTLLPAMAAADARRRDLAICPLDAEAVRRIGLVWRQSYPQVADIECLGQVVRDNLPPAVRDCRCQSLR